MTIINAELTFYHHCQHQMKQYRDIPMDLADASLVAIAEVLNQRQIFTLDHDFYIYRLWGNQTFEIIP